jgi:hypothetical protein
MESVLKLLDEFDDLMASMRHRLRLWPDRGARR